MLAVLLACSASLAWGTSDFIAGLRARQVALLWVLAVSQLAGLVLFLPAMIVIRPTPDGSHLALAALAGTLNAVALAALYRGLARGPMGVVAPIAAADAVVPLIYGVSTGDRPSTAQAAGIGLTLVGVVLAATPTASQERRPKPRADRISVALALIAALCFGGFMIALKAASEASATWAVGFSRLTTTVLVTAALLATASRLAVGGRDLPPLVSIGALDVGATMLFAAATTKGLLSVVGVLGSLYPLVTIVLATVMLHERLGIRQRFGALGALAGVALIAAG